MVWQKKLFDPGFFNVLDAYSWPGNVRELIHALESALVAAQNEPALFLKHLPTYIRIWLARASLGIDEFPDKAARQFKFRGNSQVKGFTGNCFGQCRASIFKRPYGCCQGRHQKHLQDIRFVQNPPLCAFEKVQHINPVLILPL